MKNFKEFAYQLNEGGASAIWKSIVTLLFKWGSWTETSDDYYEGSVQGNNASMLLAAINRILGEADEVIEDAGGAGGQGVLLIWNLGGGVEIRILKGALKWTVRLFKSAG